MARKRGKQAAKQPHAVNQRSRTIRKKGRGAKDSIPLAKFQELHSRMELSHSGKVTRVRLCDQVTPFAGSQIDPNYALTKSVPFFLKGQTATVDVYAQILPKLQGFGSIYQRYRVTRAKLCYQALTSAVTNGNVGLVIQDGLSPGTRTVAELASFQQSAVGPLFEDLATPEWRSLEQRWFYTRDAFSASVVPFTMNFIMQGGVSVDGTNNVFVAGLFWLDLTIEFLDLCPVPSTRITLTAGTKEDTNQVVVGGAARVDRTVRWNRAPGMSGLWGWALGQSRLQRQSPTENYALDPKQCWDMDGGNYVGAARLQISAVAASPESKVTDDSYVRLSSPPQVKRYGRADIDFLSGVDVHPGPVQKGFTKVLCSFPNLAEARRARIAGFNPFDTVPNAAGDFSVALYCQDEDGTQEVVYAKLFSLGTAAAVAEFMWRWYEDNPCTLSLVVLPTGTEQREVVHGGSVLSIQQVDDSIPALDS